MRMRRRRMRVVQLAQDDALTFDGEALTHDGEAVTFNGG
jgi:hypothetical protein